MNADKIKQAAQIAHEANRAYCATIGDSSQVSWDDAEQWQRDSAIAGVGKMAENPMITADGLHREWCDFKAADGWTYGPVKNSDIKQHPCLVPYAELPIEQRVKDMLFRAVVHSIL